MTLYTAAPRTIYFIRPVGCPGHVKIGCSIHPETRRRQLQTEAGRPLEIIAQIAGSLDDERRIHSLFWHDHIRREWFNLSPILQLLIDAVRRGDADISALPEARVRRMPWRRGPKPRRMNHSSRHPDARAGQLPPMAARPPFARGA